MRVCEVYEKESKRGGSCVGAPFQFLMIHLIVKSYYISKSKIVCFDYRMALRFGPSESRQRLLPPTPFKCHSHTLILNTNLEINTCYSILKHPIWGNANESVTWVQAESWKCWTTDFDTRWQLAFKNNKLSRHIKIGTPLDPRALVMPLESVEVAKVNISGVLIMRTFT